MSWHSGALALSLLCLGACTRSEPGDCGPAERVVDPVLLAFLSKARSAHHVADQSEEMRDVPAALSSLARLLEGPTPPGDAPEVTEVLADTRARIADLLSRSGRFDEASAQLDAGLQAMREQNYFRGHLFEVRGLLEERRAKALGEAGRTADAEKARERSLMAYEEAMKIQAAVIEKATPAHTSPRP
jgi:tetratricopeptide (TPR) repeat protein